MKLFLFRISIYLLILLSVKSLISIYNSAKYWESRVPVIKSKMNLPEKSKISLILGSSHTFFGINSQLISKSCYNYASISQSYFEDFEILKNINNKVQVTSVILPFSYFSNYSMLSETNFDNEFLRVYDYEKAFNIKYIKNSRFIIQDLILFFTINNRINKNSNRKDEIDKFGNLKNNCILNYNDISDSIIAFKRHDFNQNFKSINSNLDSIINYCSVSNIELHIIIPPFSKGYRNQISKYNPDFYDFVNNLKLYSNGRFNFINCQDFIKENEEIYFKDADHLSACGRDLFSSYLGSLILKKSTR